jgi:hypothetical protein
MALKESQSEQTLRSSELEGYPNEQILKPPFGLKYSSEEQQRPAEVSPNAESKEEGAAEEGDVVRLSKARFVFVLVGLVLAVFLVCIVERKRVYGIFFD